MGGWVGRWVGGWVGGLPNVGGFRGDVRADLGHHTKAAQAPNVGAFPSHIRTGHEGEEAFSCRR